MNAVAGYGCLLLFWGAGVLALFWVLGVIVMILTPY